MLPTIEEIDIDFLPGVYEIDDVTRDDIDNYFEKEYGRCPVEYNFEIVNYYTVLVDNIIW